MTVDILSNGIDENIIVEALDKSFSLNEFAISHIDPTLFKWELGGLTDPVGQLINWLWGNIQEAFSGLSNDIWGWLNTIKSGIITTLGSSISGLANLVNSVVQGIESAINSIGSSLSSFASSIESAIGGLQSAISQIGATLSGIVGQVVSGVQSIVQGVISDIQSIGTTLSGLIQSIISNLSALGSQIYNYISSFGESIFGYIKDLMGWISQGFKGLETAIGSIEKGIFNALGNIEKGIFNALEGLGKTITEAFQGVYKFLSGFEKEIANAIEGLPKFISSAFEDFEKWIHGAFTTVATTIGQFGQHLATFGQMILKLFGQIGVAIDQLGTYIIQGVTSTWVKVRTFLEQQYNKLVEGVRDVGVTLQGFVNPLVEIRAWLYSKFQVVLDFFSMSYQKLQTIGGQLWRGIQTVAGDIWAGVQTLSGWIMDIANSAIAGVLSSLSGVIEGCISSAFRVVSERLKNLPKEGGEVDILSYIAQGYSLEVAQQMAAAAAAEAAGEALGEQEATLEPIGIGGRLKLKLGAFIKKMASYIKEVTIDTAKYAFAALSFWVVEPTRYYVYRNLRNLLPVELPSVGEIIEFARRHMPTKEFQNFIKQAQNVLQLRGYSDWVINSMLKLASEESVKIKDRFGKERMFPVSLLYDIPSRSELCRMMMHDIIINPEDFQKAMEMSGVHPDIAYLFYLLHFNYMSLDRLWEFYCRGLAGMLTINETFLQPNEEALIGKGLGFKPAVPAQFNGKNAEKLLPLLALYAKWHNYAFFAWENGYPSDRLIALELLSKIPERIDSRWLYKWGIIDDTTVMRIITARGYNQKWVQPLAIAECLNALAEERNIARTGVIDAFIRGFITVSDIGNLLSNLTNVNILGSSVPVKFLPGEIELLTLRGKYDRAIKLLDGLSYALIDGYKENIVEWSMVTETLQKATSELSRGLNITLEFDSEYYKLYYPIADSMRTIYTIKRIRYWLRYLLMEIVRRFEEGYLTESELNNIISNIQKWAALTNEEKEALEEIAKMMLTLFNREIEAKAILKMLSRGAITETQAKQMLTKLGLNEKTAEAMIDYYAKTYTLSPSSLVELSEYVPVSERELIEKLKLVGMPVNEAKLYPAYAFARQISSYVRRMVTELIDDYADGVIDLKELEKELDNLATINGEVKKRFGVEWIVLSPTDRKLIIELAKLRRERHLKRRRRAR